MRSRGISLIEVVVAIGIAVSALAAVRGLISAAQLGDTTRDQDLALVIASSEAESLRSGGYAALPASGSFSDAQLAALTNGAGALAVTARDADTKQVVVTVSWDDGTAPRSVSLTTLIAKTGGLP